MSQYTFICEQHGVFTVKVSMNTFTGEANCPICHTPTTKRQYKPTHVSYKVGRVELPNAGRGREVLKDRD